VPDVSHWTLDAALRWALLLVLGGWGVWWALSLCVAVVDPRLAARLGPPLLRAALVGGVVAATAVPAHARQGSTGALDGLPLPQRPITATADTPAPPDRPEVHVVRPGESLWSIAHARAPGATDAELARAVARWHAANRELIGPDPDLIRPGQRLTPPGAP